MKNIKTKHGALIGKYFKSLVFAKAYYENMSDELKRHQSIVEFITGECMIVGNEAIKAIELKVD